MKTLKTLAQWVASLFSPSEVKVPCLVTKIDYDSNDKVEFREENGITYDDRGKAFLKKEITKAGNKTITRKYKTTKDGDWIYDGKTIEKYDSQNLLVSRKLFDSSDRELDIFTYERKENCEIMTHFMTAEIPIIREETTKLGNKTITKHYIYFIKFKVWSNDYQTIYEYNKDNLLVSAVRQRASGKEMFRITYTYIHHGDYTERIEYRDGEPNKKEETTKSGDKTIIKNYSYYKGKWDYDGKSITIQKGQ